MVVTVEGKCPMRHKTQVSQSPFQGLAPGRVSAVAHWIGCAKAEG